LRFRGSAVEAMPIAHYDTDLTDAQWNLIEPHLPAPKRRGRPPTPLRPLLNAILYVVKSGCQWRLLPKTFPPWQTVYHRFRQWSRDHTWAALNARLRALVRKAQGKRCRPTAAILDSQSVKSDPHGGATGYDAGKRIKGRKRHLLVDTLGLVLGVCVTPASTTERAGAQTLLTCFLPGLAWLRVLWVDGGYRGEAFAQWVKTLRHKLTVEVVKRAQGTTGFAVLPRRWIVERTFAWLMRHRRLVRDFETTEASAEAVIYIAMIRIQLRRLA
jgi:transposase